MTSTFTPDSSRAYTLAEIDKLRDVVKNEYLFGAFAGRNGVLSRSFQEADLVRIVEERVRTFMMAGVTADDLLQEEQERMAAAKATVDAIIADAKAKAGDPPHLPDTDGAFCDLNGDGCP